MGRVAISELRRLAAEDADLEISASVYAEIMVAPARAGQQDAVDAFLDRLPVEVAPIDRATAGAAADLRAKHRTLRLGDALALASARARTAELVTFDDRLRRIASETR